jgi:hypothetical protein
VQVIGHEAVRKNGEPAVIRGTQKIRDGESRGVVVHEDLAASMCAPRKEIAVRADVVEVREASGAHAVDRARDVPPELKFGPTYVLPELKFGPTYG